MDETDSGGELVTCGVGIRGAAMAVDAILWLVLWFLSIYAVAAVTGDITTGPDGTSADLEGTPALVGLALWLVLAIGFHTLAEWRYGKTLGKRLVAIEVTGADGAPLSLRASLVRNVLRLVDWLPALYLVGIAAIGLSGSDRRLGDRVADTIVVPR